MLPHGLADQARYVAEDEGQDELLGRCSLTWVFISTTRTASLIRRRRSVSNWAVRQDERRGMSVRRLHIGVDPTFATSAAK